MKSDEIRNRFLKFFEARGHKIVPSDSLVPTKDPSILFTGAGMNQFKEQFMGHNVAYKRATTSQKCLRTADLEKVGKTPGHHTFFEMLGNFSFGDYFKKDAIAWAWEFLTKELKIPAEKLRVSVYEEDAEAYNIWLKDIKVPAEHIMKMGDADNFWPAEARKNGPNGPCGPCSEIFYHTGAGEPFEIWNLVFTQYDRKDGGVLEDLPARNIDTGMGFERLASVMQGVKTNFETDIFIPIIDGICKSLDYKKGTNAEKDSHVNAIADHIRAITFTIADGVYPSNEERGFVVRKLIRRSIQRAIKIRRVEEPFLYKLVPAVAKVMKAAYPELEKQRETISQVVMGEEERFQKVLSEIAPAMRGEFEKIKEAKRTQIPGELIFKYSDEQGIPLDFQKEIADEIGLSLDIDGFNKFLEGQKERSRSKSKISKEIFAAPSGLARKKDEEWSEEEKQKIRMNHTATHLLHNALRQVLGEHAHQSGSLVYPERLRFDFTHPKKVGADEIAKVEDIVNRNISPGHEVRREVMKIEEAKKSGAIALFGEKYGEDVIVRSIGDFSKELCSGDHVKNTKELRIFKVIQETSVAAGTRRIEAVTGDAVYEWLAAQAAKAKAQLEKEIRNIEGSEEAKGSISECKDKLKETDAWLGKKNGKNIVYEDIKKWSQIENEIFRLADVLSAQAKKMEKAAARQGEQALDSLAIDIMKGVKEVKGIKVISALVSGKDMNSLRKLADIITLKIPDSVILLGSEHGEKANLVLAVGTDQVKKGLDARALIKPIAGCVGGSGGGRENMAQAGGKDTAKIKEAVSMLYKLVEENAK